jgi:hypothetical protein
MKKTTIQIKPETLNILKSEADRLKISVDELLLLKCGVPHPKKQ